MFTFRPRRALAPLLAAAAAVTGGTGVYAAARGEAIVRAEADEIEVHL